MKMLPSVCSMDTFLITALGNKPTPHKINTAATHGIRYTTYRTPHHDRIFGEREAGYRSGGQEKEWMGCRKSNLQQHKPNGITHNPRHRTQEPPHAR